MKANYDNWVPKKMIAELAAGSGVLAAGAAGTGLLGKGKTSKVISCIEGTGALVCGAAAVWSAYASAQFSYDGKRKLAQRIVEGTAGYIHLPDGGVGLDVGCGSGALTIAAAKRNPQARMVGMDRWGADYSNYSMALCRQNAEAEHTPNTSFRKGDAARLPFADCAFDAVTSNYVYHNIPCRNRQALLLETLRVLKKGGTFAIHDLMSSSRYGDMEAFCEKLRAMGYAHVELIDTADGLFMSRSEAAALFLSGSSLLYGTK